MSLLLNLLQVNKFTLFILETEILFLCIFISNDELEFILD